MKLCIHIGMSKAGSSAIQQLLASLEENLASEGIVYPRTGRRRYAHYRIVEDFQSTSDFQMLRDALAEGVERGAHTVVLSAESFWFLRPEELALLRDATSECETEVVLYLRRPGDYLASSWRQHIKRRGDSYDQEEYLRGLGDRMDYSRLLREWGRLFAVRARAYEGLRNTLESDILNAIGSHLTAPGRVVANETPPEGTLRLMLMANRMLPKTVARYARSFLRITHLGKRWLPPLNNGPFQAAAEVAINSWDRAVLSKYLREDDIGLLTGCAPASNAGVQSTERKTMERKMTSNPTAESKVRMDSVH